MSQLTNANVLQVSIIENVYWKELGLLVFVWVVFLALQISKVKYFFLPNILIHMYQLSILVHVQTLLILFMFYYGNSKIWRIVQ